MAKILLAALLLLIMSGTAHAGFIVVPLLLGAAFAATTAGIILSGVITMAVSFGLSYVASGLLGKKQQASGGTSSNAFGAQLSVRVDADVPCSFGVGTYTTAGSSVYFATYGSSGSTQNSNLIEIISLSDLRSSGLVRAFVEGAAAVLTDSGTNRGSIVHGYTGSTVRTDIAALEATVGGTFLGVLATASGVLDALRTQSKIQEYSDLLAIKFYDGTQTVADAFAVAALGTRDTQPWTFNHVGFGTTYVRVHSIYDPEKVPGRLRWRFVLKGVPLYDPRKDSSVSGGSGMHRFNDTSTHEWTDNVAVICYNICRGIYFLDVNGDRQFFYGLENTTADQFPLDVWFAAMNECDVVMTLSDGTTERQYTAGAEISVDSSPLDTIKELLKASGGRFAEVGGIYRLLIGAPGLPELSITDNNIPANREERFKPILALNSRINYITGKYTAIDDGWLPKIAPPRENTDWREEDGRRLPADLDAPLVQSARQMQQLMEQMLTRSRRQRKHVVPLPPFAFGLEPGDTISWTSARNNYSDKLFEIDGVDYETNLFSTLSITEVDPADFDWLAGQQVAEPPGQIISLRPTPKVIIGFAATGYVWSGDDLTERPAIKITWDPPEDNDIIAVRWQVRTAADPTNNTAGVTTRDDVLAGQVIIVGSLQPVTEYQVRARFESFNGFAADWSLWIPVTTPDARIKLADFSAGLKALVGAQTQQAITDVHNAVEKLGAAVAALQSGVSLDKEQLLTSISRSAGQVSASYTQAISVAVGPDSALAQAITSLSASVGTLNASLTTQFVVGAGPDGAIAAYTLKTVAENAEAGLTVVAFDDMMGGKTGQLWIEADKFYVGSSGTADFVPMFIIDTGAHKIYLSGDLIADGTIEARMIKAGAVEAEHLSADAADFLTANIHDLTADNINSNFAIYNKVAKLISPFTSTVTVPGVNTSVSVSATNTIASFTYTTVSGSIVMFASYVLGVGQSILGGVGGTTTDLGSARNVTTSVVVKDHVTGATLATAQLGSNSVSPHLCNGLTGGAFPGVDVAPGTVIDVQLVSVVSGTANIVPPSFQRYSWVYNSARVLFLEPRGT